MDLSEARKIVDSDKESRLYKCRREIEASLEKYGCTLIAIPHITDDGRIVAETKLVISNREG